MPLKWPTFGAASFSLFVNWVVCDAFVSIHPRRQCRRCFRSSTSFIFPNFGQSNSNRWVPYIWQS